MGARSDLGGHLVEMKLHPQPNSRCSTVRPPPAPPQSRTCGSRQAPRSQRDSRSVPTDARTPAPTRCGAWRSALPHHHQARSAPRPLRQNVQKVQTRQRRSQVRNRLLRVGQVSRRPSVTKSANATPLGVWNSSSQSTISLSISAVPRPAFLKLLHQRHLAMPVWGWCFSKASGPFDRHPSASAARA